jgi:methylenetetrahydrofolate reductase (NADPH)
VKFQGLREQKKVNAGAQFFQTNLIFDVDGMETWLNELAKRNVLDKVYILAGVTPIKSLKMAQKLADVPGVYLPKKILKRMEVADKNGNAQEEGIQIALEIIGKIKTYEKQGISGIHLMPVGWDNVIPRIVNEAGIQPKPSTYNLTSQERKHAYHLEK